MKGVVFNLLEEFIVENWGEKTYEDILDECTFITQEPFIGPQTYPDADLLVLIGKSVEKLEVPFPDALRTFGKWLFPKLAAAVPPEMTAHQHPKEFLQTVEHIIHVEVRKLYQDAAPPRFAYEDPGPNRLIIHYRSPRKLYDLMDGLLDGVAAHFDIPISFTRQIHQENEVEICTYELTFGA